MNLPDVQKQEPEHKIAINRVGITDFKMPIYISKQDGSIQHTVADISCYVDLAAEIKGISREKATSSLSRRS